MMPRVVCVKCERDFKMADVGIMFADMAYNPPQEMAIASADIMKCPGCGAEIVVGFSDFNHDRSRIREQLEKAEHFVIRIIRSFESNAAKKEYDKNIRNSV